MVNEDILGGLKEALARGESLKQAMQTFYNAGYSKEDIEWAAKSFQMQQAPPQPVNQQPVPQRTTNITPKSDPRVVQRISDYAPNQTVNVAPPKKINPPINQAPHPASQQVSNYEMPPKKPKKFMVFFLIFILFLLLGTLVILLLFKEEIIELFNNLF